MENKLPEGWEWKKLGEIAEKIHYGYTASAVEKQIGPKLLRITDIQDNNVNWETVPFCEIDEKDKEKYLLHEGDLVFARTGATVGKSYLLEGNVPESVFASYLIRVILFNTVIKKYVYYFFQSSSYWLQIQSGKVGAGQPNVNATKLSEITLPIPPLETQQKIVSILEKAEETKKLRAQADELTQKSLQSVFLEMFGDPVKNSKNWEKKTLKEFGEIITGNTPSREKPEYYGDYIEWIKSDNINTPYTYLTRSEEMLSEKGAKVGRIAPINSILVTCIAGSLSCIGNVAIADRSVSFNQQINAIVPNENVNTSFLYHLILNTKEYIQSHSTQSMKGMVSKGAFGSISFIIPPIEAQMKFAEFTKRVEKMITSQNKSSLEINNLFDALMQKAFTGELVS